MPSYLEALHRKRLFHKFWNKMWVRSPKSEDRWPVNGALFGIKLFVTYSSSLGLSGTETNPGWSIPERQGSSWLTTTWFKIKVYKKTHPITPSKFPFALVGKRLYISLGIQYTSKQQYAFQRNISRGDHFRGLLLLQCFFGACLHTYMPIPSPSSTTRTPYWQFLGNDEVLRRQWQWD